MVELRHVVVTLVILQFLRGTVRQINTDLATRHEEFSAILRYQQRQNGVSLAVSSLDQVCYRSPPILDQQPLEDFVPWSRLQVPIFVGLLFGHLLQLAGLWEYLFRNLRQVLFLIGSLQHLRRLLRALSQLPFLEHLLLPLRQMDHLLVQCFEPFESRLPFLSRLLGFLSQVSLLARILKLTVEASEQGSTDLGSKVPVLGCYVTLVHRLYQVLWLKVHIDEDTLPVPIADLQNLSLLSLVRLMSPLGTAVATLLKGYLLHRLVKLALQHPWTGRVFNKLFDLNLRLILALAGTSRDGQRFARKMVRGLKSFRNVMLSRDEGDAQSSSGSDSPTTGHSHLS